MFTQLTLAAALAVGAPALKDREPTQKGPGYLGIAFQKEVGGLLITDVKPDSPAARGGLKPLDLVEQVDGVNMQDADTGEFVKLVGGMRPGTVVALDVKRGGESLTLKVKLGVRPADFQSTIPVPQVPPIIIDPND